ncbi:hypothetical protein TUM19329_08270 [Legionella antarctica]|uniref:Uncharacterized protein n=1 Tax=Legionella antarctica TaxID=2708020 RepID=A0A6F8T3C6_9GAMM|nr:hypothetical protein TUM19329_08270 [Legionella antarctica]
MMGEAKQIKARIFFLFRVKNRVQSSAAIMHKINIEPLINGSKPKGAKSRAMANISSLLVFLPQLCMETSLKLAKPANKG